jgi:hypothetical protein
MPPVKRPLRTAAMVGGAGYAISERHQSGAFVFAPGAQEPIGAAAKANRVDALSKLGSLLDLGVLTQEQYDSEYGRLTEGDAGKAGAQRQLGPVQLLVIPFTAGDFDVTILEELRRLREHQMIRLLDLLFVAKDEVGNIEQLRQSELTVQEAATFGSLVGALFGLGGDSEEGSPANGAAGDAVDHQNGWLRDAAETWFLADTIPAGEAAAVALVEHQWAIALCDAIETAGGHDLVDRWLHPQDLIAIGAEGA